MTHHHPPRIFPVFSLPNLRVDLRTRIIYLRTLHFFLTSHPPRLITDAHIWHFRRNFISRSHASY